MCYYGIVWSKDKTPADRFEEHMCGKGGKYLYNEGVLKYGRENFSLEILKEDSLEIVRDMEIKLNKTNLFPCGYNGNTSHAIINDDKSHEVINNKKKSKWLLDPTLKPVPPNWKGKKRSEAMKQALSYSKIGHIVAEDTKTKISKSLKGTTQSLTTITKRAKTLEKNDKSYNRKKWLLISPENKKILIHGSIHKTLKEMGLSYSKLFSTFLNSGQKIYSKNKSPLVGWLVYNDINLITKLYEE